MTVAGGLRVRFIHDSLHKYIKDALTELGWLDTNRRHMPVIFADGPVPSDQEVKLNTISLADEDLIELDAEMGSNLTETSWLYYLDFYAENATIGKELINDVRDILGGRMPSIGCDSKMIPVYDFREQPNPPVLFTVEIEGPMVDRSRDFVQPWLKNWYTCRFEVNDFYGPASDATEES